MDTKRLQQLAGILLESDDEDGLSPAERELATKAEKDLKKKGVDVDAESKAEEERRAKKRAAKKEVAPKADKPAEKPAEEKKDDAAPAATPAASTKKMHQAADWLKANKEATRGQFMAAAEKWGMARNFANVAYYKIKNKLKECYVLVHPSVARFALAHNRQFNRYQWINLEESAGLAPILTATKKEADKIALYMLEQNSQLAVVKKVEDE